MRIHYTGCGYYYYIAGKGNGGQVSKHYKKLHNLRKYGRIAL